MQRRDGARDDPMDVDTLATSLWKGSCSQVCWTCYTCETVGRRQAECWSVGETHGREVKCAWRSGGGGGSDATSHETCTGNGKGRDKAILDSSCGKSKGEGKIKARGSGHPRTGNSLEDDRAWRGSDEVEQCDEAEQNRDWLEETDHTGSEITVRFEETLDTRDLLTGALEIGASERDLSSPAVFEIIAFEGLSLAELPRQWETGKIEARGDRCAQTIECRMTGKK